MAKKVKEDFYLKRLREERGVTIEEMCERLGLTQNHYRMKENDLRRYKNEEDNEQFYADTAKLIEQIAKEHAEKADSIVDNLGEDDDSMDMYVKLTSDIYEKIKARLLKRENIIAVCGDYGVDYEEVDQWLLSDGLPELTFGYKGYDNEDFLTLHEVLGDEDETKEETEISLLAKDDNILSK